MNSVVMTSKRSLRNVIDGKLFESAKKQPPHFSFTNSCSGIDNQRNGWRTSLRMEVGVCVTDAEPGEKTCRCVLERKLPTSVFSSPEVHFMVVGSQLHARRSGCDCNCDLRDA